MTVPDELPTLVKHEDTHAVVHHHKLAAGGHGHGDGLHHLLVAKRPDLVDIIFGFIVNCFLKDEPE